jgi:glycosyltransferase involved in cell wall biosynthesis
LDVAVLVPVYNEAGTVVSVVHACVDVCERQGYAFDVVVLDDGSTDWTADLRARLDAVEHVEVRRFPENRGKGAVLNEALQNLSRALVVVIDADGEYDPSDIPAVVEPLAAGKADWVFGSRYGFDRPRPRQYALTYAVNRFFSRFFSLLGGARVHDVLTGLYGCTREAVEGVHLQECHFAYTPELLWRIKRKRPVQFAEVPVSYTFRGYDEGKKIRWWETFTVCWAFIKYRFVPMQMSGRKM